VKKLNKKQKTLVIAIISVIFVLLCFVLICRKGETDFNESGTLENCSESASDMPYDNSCWRISYTEVSEDSSAGESLMRVTLTFDENSLCNLGSGYEECSISDIESYYQDSVTSGDRKISVEGISNTDNSQIITVVKLEAY